MKGWKAQMPFDRPPMQATTAFELAYTMATKGAVNGATINDIKPLDKPVEETTANGAAHTLA